MYFSYTLNHIIQVFLIYSIMLAFELKKVYNLYSLYLFIDVY